MILRFKVDQIKLPARIFGWADRFMHLETTSNNHFYSTQTSENKNEYESSVNVVAQRGFDKNEVYGGVENTIGLEW